MNAIKIQQWEIRQLRFFLNIAEPHERLEIKKRIINYQIGLALLLHQKDLEQSIDGPFDPAVSRKLDAIKVLLET